MLIHRFIIFHFTVQIYKKMHLSIPVFFIIKLK